MKFLFLLSLLVLNGCGIAGPIDAAHKVSGTEGFVKYYIQASPFLLTSYERVKTQNAAVTVYIEGDGRAWLSKKRPSRDPTPKDPIALKLASIDPADNVIYLARPCQYTKTIDGSVCEKKYWTSHRFSSEVIEGMNNALEDIKRRRRITQFHLIGFSGGGNIAALLATKRKDVLSIRTVAGNLNHQLQSKIHNVSYMPASLNAQDIAPFIADIPQLHFVGGKDRIVPQEIYESYRKASGPSGCVHSHIVREAGHTQGWQSVWQELLKRPFDCVIDQ